MSALLVANLRRTVEALCSDACAGRAAGSAGGRAARAVVLEALRGAGCPATEQPVPGCGGANLVSQIDGTSGRYVLVGAHYDHLGRHGAQTFHGADDNAAAVAVLVELARALAARPPEGRGVVLAAFDGEEPPHFHTAGMGSVHFVNHPTVPLDQLDLMVCMDLVGHALGPVGAPDAVRQSLFALGAERSAGTSALVDSLAESEAGVVVRRVDAEVIPPLSDHWAFWQRQVPFLFLTCGRWRHYHQPSDTPEKLDWDKLAATTRWLERLVRQTCARPPGKVAFTEVHDDASTLRSLKGVLTPLSGQNPMAAGALGAIVALERRLDPLGRLPASEHAQTQLLVEQLETALS